MKEGAWKCHKGKANAEHVSPIGDWHSLRLATEGFYDTAIIKAVDFELRSTIPNQPTSPNMEGDREAIVRKTML